MLGGTSKTLKPCKLQNIEKLSSWWFGPGRVSGLEFSGCKNLTFNPTQIPIIRLAGPQGAYGGLFSRFRV